MLPHPSSHKQEPDSLDATEPMQNLLDCKSFQPMPPPPENPGFQGLHMVEIGKRLARCSKHIPFEILDSCLPSHVQLQLRPAGSNSQDIVQKARHEMLVYAADAPLSLKYARTCQQGGRSNVYNEETAWSANHPQLK